MFKNLWTLLILTFIVADFITCKPVGNNSDETLEVKKKHRDFNAIDRNKVKRSKRQVVQPTWLLDGDTSNSFIDSRVRVTEQNLREAEAIREAIQAAVDANTFAVDPDEPTASIKPSVFKFPKYSTTTTDDEQEIPQAPKSPFSFFSFKWPKIPGFERTFTAFQNFLKPLVGSTAENVATTATDTTATTATTASENGKTQSDATASTEINTKADLKTAWLEFQSYARKKWPTESANFEPFLSSTVDVPNANADKIVGKSNEKPLAAKPKSKFVQGWLEFIENSKEIVGAIPAAETAEETAFLDEFENLWSEFEDTFMQIFV